MNNIARDPKFFVAGGPVQPHRACYVSRAADAEMLSRLLEGEYCHLIAPPQSGKTSLMAHTTLRLRGSGVSVATADLGQIGQRDAPGDIGRWYYSIAYRIARELRVRTEIYGWWQEHAGLTATQRLRAFLQELVLAETSGRIVIFIDRAEATLGEPLMGEIFRAVRACHDARATDPEFSRLTFCILSSASPRVLVTGGNSPFDVSTPIALTDFTREQTLRLATGLGGPVDDLAEIADCVWHWTSGQPYLTQRLLRGLSRRGDRPVRIEDVNHLAETLFLAPHADQTDPHLSAIARTVLAESPRRRERLSLYGRIRKGAVVPVDPVDPVQRELLAPGLLVAGEVGSLGVRNRVYREVFTARWANRHMPIEWRSIAVIVLVLAFVVAVPVWYTDYLPRPYMRTLSDPARNYVEAADAHRRLGMLPGYGGTADQMFIDWLAGQSRNARNLQEVRRIGERLAGLAGGDVMAVGLEAEFLQRRALEAALRGDRDGALMYRLQALPLAAGEPAERQAHVANLWGDGYPGLIGTVRPDPPLRGFAVDEVDRVLTVLDGEHRVRRWRIGDRGLAPLEHLQLEAEERVGIRQVVVNPSTRRVGRVRLSVVVNHRRPADVVVSLRSPTGRTATVGLDGAPTGTRPGEFVFDSGREPGLRALLEERVAGSWTASFADLRPGTAGSLVGWSLALDGRMLVPEGEGAGPTPIPEARPAPAALSELSPDGRYALVYPAAPEVSGDVLVYDVVSGRRLRTIPRASGNFRAYFVREGQSVLVQGERALELWPVAGGERVGRIPVQLPPRNRPILSANGQFLAVDVVSAEGEHALAVWDLARMRVVRRIGTGVRPALAMLDDSGRVIAIGDDERLVRLWNLADGSLAAELPHSGPPMRIWLSPGGRWLGVEDGTRNFTLWDAAAPARPVLQRQGTQWSVAFSAADRSVLFGSPHGRYELVGLPSGRALAPAFEHGIGGAGRPRSWLTDGLAVTWDGRRALKVWREPAAGPDAGTWQGNPALSIARGALAPAGRAAAVGTLSGEVRLARAAPSGSLHFRAADEPGFIGHLRPVTALGIADSGAVAASGAMDGTVRAWNVVSGVPRDFFGRHPDGAVLSLTLQAAGRYVVSASHGTLLALDAGSGQVLSRAAIESLRPSLLPLPAADQVLVVGDRGGVARWTWRGDTYETLVADGTVTDAAVSDDGRLLATVSGDNTVRLHELPGAAARPKTVTISGPPEALAFAGGSALLAVSGVWLHVLDITDAGLTHRTTRHLPGAPLAVATGTQAGRLALLLQEADAVTRLSWTEPAAGPGPPVRITPELRADLGRRLNLTIDGSGALVPLEP